MRLVLFAAALALCASAHAQLSPAELAALARFQSNRDADAARAQFVGQGARVAEHYLRHTGTPPDAGAYFFVLESVADTEAALALIRGLANPPEPVSGPQFESGGKLHRLRRYEGEIEAALESVLSSEAVARDPRVAHALVEAVAAMRKTGMATRAAALLGKCRSEEARQALRQLAADPDAQLRSVAMAALGSAGAGPDTQLLVRALLDDREPRARIEAAAAIAKLQAREALPGLQRALSEERNPQVTDAVLQALAKLDALPADPQQCFDAAARSWELSTAALALGCWRAQASREGLLQAALEAPPVVRALTITALFERPAQRDLPLVRFPQTQAPPPPIAAPGVRPSIALLPPPAPAPPQFDVQTRRRLLDSTVQVLSRASRGHLARPETISGSVAYQLTELLYDIAGGDMRLALEHADRISTPASRSVNDGRLNASRALAGRDARAYASVRAPRQAALAGALCACALFLLVFTQTRAAALAAALPLGAWAAWSLSVGAVRELPPLVLAPLTIVGSAAISAALVTGAATLWRSRGHAQGWVGALVTGLAATGVAAAAAFFFCGAMRWYDVFPIGGEGWELIFDPLGAALAALPLAALGLAGAAAATMIFPTRRSDG